MPSVAIIGTRGYPSYYGGFETAVRKLAPFLCDAGWDVTVYGRPGATLPHDAQRDERVNAVETFGIESKSLSTLSFGYSATNDAVRRKVDAALVMNVANGFWLPTLRRANIPTLVNVDGIEWDRDKWSAIAKRAFKQGARLTAKHATKLVFDAEAIGDRWKTDFGREGIFLPYGGEPSAPQSAPLGLPRRGYVLLVARFVPENTISAFFDAVPRIQESAPVVIVGSTGYGGEFDERAAALAAAYERVQWLGHVSNDDLLAALWQNAGVYFHGHSVGGTNPALVQAMASGAPIVARDTVYNAEVLADGSQLCEPNADAIAASIRGLLHDSRRQEAASARNQLRASKRYSWENICGGYESALRDLVGTRTTETSSAMRSAATS
ncbi:glycosyl transferase [Microbacterium sp. B35-04]|uniref:glycosyltransferase n=1 Tax=Microbacterium sp. B35-04 TaxID=1961716 RepID=UPI0013D48C0E|nr:glycosyltransferase [Microbacterium sp. B35-04]KAF2413433.1 glycosyl transferase [Microbacterium sp. B35-04]